MAAEILKLEAAARVAMGHFDGPGIPARPRSRFPYAAYALLALAIAVGLALSLI